MSLCSSFCWNNFICSRAHSNVDAVILDVNDSVAAADTFVLSLLLILQSVDDNKWVPQFISWSHNSKLSTNDAHELFSISGCSSSILVTVWEWFVTMLVGSLLFSL